MFWPPSHWSTTRAFKPPLHHYIWDQWAFRASDWCGMSGRSLEQSTNDGVTEPIWWLCDSPAIVCYRRGLIWSTDRGQTSFMEYTSVTSVKSACPFNRCLNSRRYTNQTGRRAALRVMNVGCFRALVCLLFVVKFYRGCNAVYRGTKTSAHPSSEETPLAHEV